MSPDLGEPHAASLEEAPSGEPAPQRLEHGVFRAIGVDPQPARGLLRGERVVAGAHPLVKLEPLGLQPVLRPAPLHAGEPHLDGQRRRAR